MVELKVGKVYITAEVEHVMIIKSRPSDRYRPVLFYSIDRSYTKDGWPWQDEYKDDSVMNYYSKYGANTYTAENHYMITHESVTQIGEPEAW